MVWLATVGRGFRLWRFVMPKGGLPGTAPPTACGCEARLPFAPGNNPHKTPPAKSPADLSCHIYNNKNIGVLLFLTM